MSVHPEYLGHPSQEHASNQKARQAIGDAFLVGALCLIVSVFLTRYVIFFDNGELDLPVFVTGNEESHFELVRAIVEGHTFAIEEFRHPSNNDVAAYGGHLYTNKPPGFAFLSTPLYALFYKLLPVLAYKPIPSFLPFVSAVMNGAAVGFVYLLALDLGASRQAAAFCALVAGLGTILLVYATSFMNHVSSVAFLLAALWTGFRYRATLKPAFLISAAFSMGYSIAINYTTGVLLLPTLIYLLWTLWRARHGHRVGRVVGMAGLVGAVPLALLAYYNFRCFGGFLNTAYSHYLPPPSIQYGGPVEAYFGGAFLRGLWGFLFSRSRGMFVYTPILLCAAPGYYVQLKKGKFVIETTILVITASLNIVMFAPYRYWFGGHSIGPRHILPAIALTAVLTYPCLERLIHWNRWPLYALTFHSIIIHMMLTLLSHNPRALALSWLDKEGDRLGNLYTEILPLITTTRIDIWGQGIFRVMKLVLLIAIPALAGWIGWRWKENQYGGDDG